MTQTFPCLECGEMPTVFTIDEPGEPRLYGMSCDNLKCSDEHVACGWTMDEAIKCWNSAITGRGVP